MSTKTRDVEKTCLLPRRNSWIIKKQLEDDKNESLKIFYEISMHNRIKNLNTVDL